MAMQIAGEHKVYPGTKVLGELRAATGKQIRIERDGIGGGDVAGVIVDADSSGVRVKVHEARDMPLLPFFGLNANIIRIDVEGTLVYEASKVVDPNELKVAAKTPQKAHALRIEAFGEDAVKATDSRALEGAVREAVQEQSVEKPKEPHGIRGLFRRHAA